MLKSFLAALLCCLGISAATAAPTDTGLPSAAPLFAATLNDFNDAPQALAGLRGKPLIVNFWARWCVPCRDEIPELVRLHDDYEKRGLTVVGIALDDNLANTRDFAKAYDMRYTNLLGKAQGIELMRSIGNPKAIVPYTLVIDRGGNVIGTRLGPMTRDELAAYVGRLLGKN